MANQGDADLENTIKGVVEKIRRFKGRGIGEQNTKASLIEPILEALGWDIRDPDEVHREFKPVPRDSPVDYALKLIRKPRLFVEAKGLDENLSDRKWIAQVLGYATVAGVEWCVLSDGDEFRFYNANAPLDADEKLFCKLRLSEVGEADAAKTLLLISRSNMEENLLDVLWSAHFVDRQVRESLRGLIDSADRRFVKLIRSVAQKLTPKEIAESLRRLDIRIEPPANLPDAAGTAAETGGRSAAAKRAWETRRAKDGLGSESAARTTDGGRGKKRKPYIGVSLAEIIAAGILKPPLRLFRKYRGKTMEGTLAKDGAVEFDGEVYKSLSTAAEAARKSIMGRRMNTNGWSFWQYTDSDGKTRTLEHPRSQYIANQQKQ